MRRRLPLIRAMGAVVCWIAAAALFALVPVVGDTAVRIAPAQPKLETRPALEPIAKSASRSCFWSRGKVRWCLPNGWAGDEWSISKDGGRYYVFNHRDEVLGYLRPATRGGWRAMVLTCPDNPPKAWRQGCGYVRDGRAIPVSRTVLNVFTKGRRVGTARGPAAVAVAAYKLVLGDM